MDELLKNFDLLPRDLVAIPLMTLFFALFWKAFGNLVVSRYLALFEARESKSSGASQGADLNLAEAQKIMAEYEEKLLSERQQIAKSLQPKIASAREEASRIIESAEAEAATLIESTRQEVAEEEKRLMTIIERDSEALAISISERALA